MALICYYIVQRGENCVYYCDSELFCFRDEYIGGENQQVNIIIEILWKNCIMGE